MPLFKATIVCKACGGTGLYVGMAERDGAAVICWQCNGTGAYEYEEHYEVFTERKKRYDVRRVFAHGGGYVHTAEDAGDLKFSEAGAEYGEWLEGKRPAPMKSLYCPYQWTNQDMQSRDHTHYAMYQTRCSVLWGGMIKDCEHFSDKAKCWELFEAIGKDWD